MMQVRAYIIHTSNEALAMACTIAIRYSAVRRQGYDADSEESAREKRADNAPNEFQVLDYRQQQYRLLPLLAASYAIFFTGKRVLSRLKEIEMRLVSGDAGITKTVVADVHATTSALKSYCTTFTADGIEDCRKACGGHGFLVCSGLGLWWLADKVRDLVNANPRKDAEINSAQPPHNDDVPPQA